MGDEQMSPRDEEMARRDAQMARADDQADRRDAQMARSDEQMPPPAMPVEGGRTRWSRLAALGLFMEGLAPLLMLGGGLLYGYKFDQEETFFLVPAAAGLIGAFLVLRFGTWAKIVGIVLALVPAAMMFWTAFGLSNYDSFFEFIPGLLVIPGAIIAIVSCVAAIMRRDRRSMKAEGGERTLVAVIVGVLVIAAVASGIFTYMGRATATQAGAATIAAHDFEFSPKEVEIEEGDTITVTSDDPFVHTFTITELGIDERLTPGDSINVRIDRAGTYVFFCRPHSDAENPDPEEDMAGTLTVS